MRPEPGAFDELDCFELSHDRFLMLYQVDPNHVDNLPRLLIEEYDSFQELEDLSPGGSIWVHPEDLPKLIGWLEGLLQAFRECAKEDRSKSPSPYWGELDGGAHGDRPARR